MVIYFCTTNRNKFLEYKEILSKFGVQIRMLKIKLIEIQAKNLEEVATFKANLAFKIVKKPVIVEDAGLFIKALNGFPGVYSSFVFKTIGNDGILKLMKNVKDRTAKFRAVIAFRNKKGTFLFKGECKGRIAFKKRGKSGFGFDPIFIPYKSTQTFAENLELKNRISHRRKALEKFVKFLKK